MSDTKEWAIRDEATGEWWDADALKWGTTATRYVSYASATESVAWLGRYQRPMARIVPAPPRQMTDDECWVWIQPKCLLVMGAGPGWSVEQIVAPMTLGITSVAIGKTPCDAIRAARKALEGK